MKLHTFFSLFFVCLSIFVSAQETTVFPGSYAPGNASVAYFRQWQPFQNTSALALEQHISAGLVYQNRYFAKELSNEIFYVTVPTKLVNISGSFSYFGYDLYNEMLSEIAFSRAFGRLRIGVGFDYYSFFVSQTDGYKGTFTANVGAQMDVSSRLTIGFSIFNPTLSSINDSYTDRKLPTILSLGTNYKMGDKIYWLVEVEKNVNLSMNFATGFDYLPYKNFALRLGIYGSDYVIPTIGVGYKWSYFQIDIHSELHPILGTTFLISTRYNF